MKHHQCKDYAELIGFWNYYTLNDDLPLFECTQCKEVSYNGFGTSGEAKSRVHIKSRLYIKEILNLKCWKYRLFDEDM